MKYSDDLEDLIKKALESEHEEVVKSYDDMNIWQQSFSVFKGKQKLAPIVNYISIIAFGIGAIYALYKLFTGGDTTFWLLILNITLVGSSINKIWHWMEINKNAVNNEIKLLRLELKSQLENQNKK